MRRGMERVGWNRVEKGNRVRKEKGWDGGREEGEKDGEVRRKGGKGEVGV